MNMNNSVISDTNFADVMGVSCANGGLLARPACGNTEGIHGRALVRLLNDIEML